MRYEDTSQKSRSHSTTTDSRGDSADELRRALQESLERHQ